MLGYAPHNGRYCLPSARARRLGKCSFVAPNAGPALPRFIEHPYGRANLPGCAKTALESIMFDERSLHRMKPSGRAESFDCDDAIAIESDGQCQA
jgi:hypothetical protein